MTIEYLISCKMCALEYEVKTMLLESMMTFTNILGCTKMANTVPHSFFSLIVNIFFHFISLSVCPNYPLHKRDFIIEKQLKL